MTLILLMEDDVARKTTTYKRVKQRLQRKGLPPAAAKKIARSKQNKRNAKKRGRK